MSTIQFDPDTHTLHAAGRTWHADPTATTIEDHEHPAGTLDPSLACCHRTRRCVIRFESGWSASVVWGTGTYSDNHDTLGVRGDALFTEEPTTVEVGVLDHTGELRRRRHVHGADGTEWSDVESYLDDLELVALLDHLATLPSDYDYGTTTIDELTELALQVERATRRTGN